jgi:dsDNA-specific endonuclease/ATPase MutS2
MTSKVVAGDSVQTPYGTGIARDIRKNGQIVVEIGARLVVFDARHVTALATTGKAATRKTPAPAPRRAASFGSSRGPRATREIDLHGLVVAEALTRAEQAISDALIDDVSELRLIHGRSGGRIRAALHRRLREIPAVRSFRIDPANAGVTIANL